MRTSQLISIFIGLFFWHGTFGQTAELRKIDISLSGTFKKLVAADNKSRYENLAPLFNAQLLEQLQNPLTFENKLDSLSKFVTMITSPDKKVKFYSWDDLTGGTWHSINCVAQYRSADNKIIVQQIHSGKEHETGEFTDSEIYEVNEYTYNSTKYYITFALGTHGTGHEHRIVQVFSITSNKLVKCKSCFSDNHDLVIQYPRGDKAKLSFSSASLEIKFNDYKYDYDVGFFQSTGRLNVLRLVKGVFIVR